MKVERDVLELIIRATCADIEGALTWVTVIQTLDINPRSRTHKSIDWIVLLVQDGKLQLAILIWTIIWIHQSINLNFKLLSTYWKRERIDESDFIDTGINCKTINKHLIPWRIYLDVAWECYLHIHAIWDVAHSIEFERKTSDLTKLFVCVNYFRQWDLASLTISNFKISLVLIVVEYIRGDSLVGTYPEGFSRG